MVNLKEKIKDLFKINFHLFIYFRILAPNSNYQDVETLYNFLIKYEVWKVFIYYSYNIYILFGYK